MIDAASLPEKTTLKLRPRFAISASSYWTNVGSAPRNWPLSPDSEVLNRSAYLLRLFQSVMSGYLSTIHFGTYQPMIPLTPFGPASTASFSSRDVLLLELGMAPVLEDDVDLAGLEALPGDLLGEGARLDLVAHLLEQALGDRDVGRGADPLVDHHLDGALVAGALAGRRRRRPGSRPGRCSADAGGCAAARARCVGGAVVAPDDLAQPTRTRLTIATPANQRAHRSVLHVRSLLLLCRLAPPALPATVVAATVLPGALRDPIQHDPEQHDRDARGEALSEVLALGEAGDDVEA